MRFLLLIAAGAALLTGGCDRQSAGQSQADAPASPPRPGGPGLSRDGAGMALPAQSLRGPNGKDISLATIAAGKPLLVNLWATWCAPCIKELPTLAALAARPGAPQVIALSQDTSDQAEVDAFLTEKKLDLEPYQDKDMAIGAALGVQILPTTILYGSDGKEIWRYTGDLDWTGAKAGELLKEAK